MRYPTPALAPDELHVHTLEIEKSRFITWIGQVATPQAFEQLLTRARGHYPDASHHCSAFIAGAPGEQVAIGFSDDGEPGGTAGRPMFQALDGSGIGRIGVVVTRYFGGTKLGTGGLVRAYTQAVVQALDTLPLATHTERRECRIRVGFGQEAETRHWLAEREIPVDGVSYSSDGVLLSLGWPDDDSVSMEALEQRLRGELTRLDA
ncbi:IMPACT family protein [Salinicola aestuarinus]|uniref:IMPACT family protein n=1 Tax=Salinicola aestuarinus TaxID=1949082 RepID=UPI000DA23A7A|nr:YigZ family protein [Salinicola aestuarinus]